jgi:hypothetical protein
VHQQLQELIKLKMQESVSITVRSLKFGFGLMAIIMCVNNSIGVGRIFPYTENLALTLKQFNLILISMAISLVIFALLWRPRAIAVSS